MASADVGVELVAGSATGAAAAGAGVGVFVGVGAGVAAGAGVGVFVGVGGAVGAGAGVGVFVGVGAGVGVGVGAGVGAEIVISPVAWVDAPDDGVTDMVPLSAKRFIVLDIKRYKLTLNIFIFFIKFSIPF